MMRERRALVLYAGLLLLFFVVLCHLYLLASNHEYAARAQNQTVTTLKLPKERGDFYDRDGTALTGYRKTYYALCVPGEKSYARLFQYGDAEAQALLYRRRNSATPFLIEVDRDLTAQGVYTLEGSRRYPAQEASCVHLLGYCDAQQKGVVGLEAALEEQLAGGEKQDYVECVTNAQGALMEETQPQYHAIAADGADVQLTISAPVQLACEAVARNTMSTGCILVLDTATAEVLASVSVPGYDPQKVAKSIAAENSPLLNRALCEYNVGSVFKPVLAAAALQEGCADLMVECVGYVELNGHIYRCAGGIPHGEVDLATALEKSCNCYFIALGAQLGSERLERYAADFGFGQPIYLAGGLRAAAGNLPPEETLRNVGQRANFSFGQGLLTATPLQLTAMMNAIAADGSYRVPTFLRRIFESDTGITRQGFSAPEQRQVISPENAARLREMLAGVVAEGTGKAAQCGHGTAAGKTGTAQTGRFDADGEEYKDLWFAGFYPAEQPRYTVVVMQDEKIASEYSSAAVFAQVCRALYYLDEGLQQDIWQSEKEKIKEEALIRRENS